MGDLGLRFFDPLERMDEEVGRYLSRYEVSKATRKFLESEQRMLVAGQWVGSGERSPLLVEEFSSGGRLATIPQANESDVNNAVAAARDQMEGGEWSRLSPLEREKLMHGLADQLERNAQELAEIESLDAGKSRMFAREVDVQGAIDTLRYFAGWASKIQGRTQTLAAASGGYLAYTLREPVGVVASIVPWNFPLQTLVWKLAATLASGCSTVIKPSELTSLSALRLAQLWHELSPPDGVVNILTGVGEKTGMALVQHPDVSKISFTGSTAVGKKLGALAARDMKRITLELGGKSPVIVLEDADIAHEAEAVGNGIFFNSGQLCDAGSRVYVHESVYREFLDALKGFAQGLRIAPGLDPDCYLGPLAGKRQYDTVVSYIKQGLEEGAELVCGGLPEGGAGWFVAPTVFAGCENDMAIMREEIFGPVLATASFRSDDEAVALANDSNFGLSSAIYSRDFARVHALVPRLKAGTVSINGQGTIDPAIPFGGYKESGVGKDLGPEQLEHFLEAVSLFHCGGLSADIDRLDRGDVAAPGI